MIIDIHIHEKTYSDDSLLSLKEIIPQAKTMGLNGICITDHESMDIADEAYRLSREENFLVLVGAEILTFEGDMLVFGLQQLPKEMIHAAELMDIVKRNKGIAISAHPFRQNNRGIGYNNRKLQGFWGIEAYNGSTPPHHNLLAQQLSMELNLPALGGSDAHHLQQVGKYATKFPDGIRDEQDLIQAIMAREVSPVAFSNGVYQSINSVNTFNKAV
ncbi:hypothetical protein SAMN05660297_01913 [Natronincola peptidivorans]|uniref:Polymerase/histidinol phosphatase N-terminal domain-containing protein n=1 Tax=Natronincola peptidivorans TaxID=426128 RepID=A0A1I0DA94_9FIRM|nr:PHP domain-containing protein [Natronincola peptidivorans]SET28472.1 hypothetical protein SAMN05660297_01913 [Natronincola peptidivorans]